MKVYGLSCLCGKTFEVLAGFDLEQSATYTHCPECAKLIKLWGQDDYFIYEEEEAFL